MTQYTTQMDAARQGIITPQMEIVAEKEHFDVEELRELIAKGQVRASVRAVSVQS